MRKKRAGLRTEEVWTSLFAMQRIARTFAASFVLTLGAGCMTTTTSTAPPPDEPGSPQPRLQRQADGTCLKTFEVDCPPETMCNPPPPEVVNCDTGEPVVPEERNLPPIGQEPAPEGEPTKVRPERPDPGVLPPPSGKPGTSVVRRAEGTCWETTDCPPNAKCDPPPPRQVECP